MAWTRWTAALAWGEQLTDWAWAQHLDVLDWESPDRPHVMLVVAFSVQKAEMSPDWALRPGPTDPTHYGDVPLVWMRDLMTSEAMTAIITPGSWSGGPSDPLGVEVGAAEHLELVQICREDPSRWTRLLEQARRVLTDHLDDAGSTQAVLRDRMGPLRKMERQVQRDRFEQALSEEDY